MREAIRAGLAILVVLAIGALLVIVAAVAAQARWKPEYGNVSKAEQAWFAAQHNSQGQWCCDQADGHRFDGEWRFTKEGGVAIRYNGKVYKLPPYMVLKVPNPTGSAAWWFLDLAGGEHVDYCVAPGSMG